MKEDLIRMFEWFGHHKILRQFVLDAEVVNDEPLRVGAGKTATFEPVDLIVLKVYDVRKKSYLPIIPGSSWKGVFRAHSYRLCVSRNLKVCEGLPRATHLSGNDFYQLEGLGADHLSKLRALVNGDIKACLLDLMFGAPGYRSHVDFSDSLPLNSYKLGYRTMVAIDRRTGTAGRGMLFSVEYVEPGCVFSFRLVARNLPNYALGLIAEVLQDINSGMVRVGGLKSRGFGRVKIRNLRIWVRESEGTPLRALDPIDSEVPVNAEEISGEEAWDTLKKLIEVWHKSLEKLRRVSNSDWRWGVVFEAG